MSAFGSSVQRDAIGNLTEYDGCKYVFAYHSENDKCWYVQPRSLPSVLGANYVPLCFQNDYRHKYSFSGRYF